MKKFSLQWRITLMTALLIGLTCIAMNLMLCSSGVYYMDRIADALRGGGTVIITDEGTASFDLDAAIQSAAERYDAGDENWATAELEENGVRVRIVFDAIVLEENDEQNAVRSASFAVLLLENGGETAKNPPSFKK